MVIESAVRREFSLTEIEEIISARYGLPLIEWISDVAASLRGRSGTLPVHACELAESVGASLSIVADAASFGSTEHLEDDLFEIRISEDLDPWQKNFTIAHEIGHIMLYRASDGSLTSGRVVEEFCDDFALHVLCPLIFVDQFIRARELSLGVMDELARSLFVPSAAFASLVADYYPATYCWGAAGYLKHRGPFDPSSFREEMQALHEEAEGSGSSVRRRIEKGMSGVREWSVEVRGDDADRFRALVKPVGPDVRYLPAVRAVNIPRVRVLESERGQWQLASDPS